MDTRQKVKADVIVFDQGNTLILDPFLAVMELQKGRFQEVCQNYAISVSVSSLCEEWIKANKQVDYPYIGHFCQEEPIIHASFKLLASSCEFRGQETGSCRIQNESSQLAIPEGSAPFLALDLLKEYRSGLCKVIMADPRTQEVKDTLQKLAYRGKKLGIFSNDRTVGLGLVLNAMEIRSLFQYIETSESIGAEKPDPRVFQHMLAYFQTDPQNIVYIGDDPIRDIDAAKEQGLKAIQYKVDAGKYTEPWRDYTISGCNPPDAIIDHFSKILYILE